MKVFVSSTFIDLKEYRREVAKAILDAGMQPILVEDFQAGLNITDSIAHAIAEADIFLNILGFRLGTFSPENGKSWLEYEYEIAMNKQKPILTFMLSDDAMIKTSDIEDNINEVFNFRNQIKSKFLVQYFSSPKDIYQSTFVALLKLRDREKVAPIDKKVEAGYEPQKFIENKTVRILKLLLSSPGDVGNERELVSKAVFRFNQECLIDKSVFIKLIRWEDMAPQIANGPQKVVNKQLEAFDIFLGIMWNRFGTPTDLASSGTEEEFNDALSSWQKYSRPWITFYFCNRPTNFITSEQLDQKSKVLSFKQKLMSLGLIKSYEYLEEFENIVFHDLIKITDHYLKK